MCAAWWRFKPDSEQAGLHREVTLLAARQGDQRAGLLRGKKTLWPTGGGQNIGRHLLVMVVQQPAGCVRELRGREARHQRVALRRMQLKLYLITILRQIVRKEDDLGIAELRLIELL